MGLWGNLFGKENKKITISAEETTVFKDIEDNLNRIKSILEDCGDVVYREFTIGEGKGCKAAIVYIDGLAKTDLLNDYVLENLMVEDRLKNPNKKINKEDLSDTIKDKTLAVSDFKEVETIEEAVLGVLSGDTAFILDEYEKILVIATKGWSSRGVSQPETEAVVRGPRDGLVENLRVNTASVRRRIRDPKLKLKGKQIGRRSKTDICILYIEDIVNQQCLEEVNRRLDTIDIDAIIDSGYVEQLIEDNWRSPFPQIQSTERPDVLAAGLYEGRVIILVDNSPFALIVPASFNAMMQSAEDYYDRWGIASFIRVLRYIGAIISLYAPSLYIAITSFHPQMLPSNLSQSISANREGVPFPSVIEAIVMELTLEMLREAGVRLPGPIGATIGIVGGLVIGQAAVEAGIVGPIMVIVVAITAISSFSIPRYNLAIGLRLLRFLLIIASATLGLYGVMLVTIFIVIHLCSLKSFGVPYLTPFTTYISKYTDLKDTLVRAPLSAMHLRPTSANPKQKVRMKDNRKEDFNEEE